MAEEKSSEKSKEFRNIGNTHFQKGNFYEALKNYNKSLCFAVTQEDVAFAVGNQSAVFFELKLYEKAYTKTLLAEPAYPKDKIAKIIERREKCIQIMQEMEESSETPSERAIKDLIKLSYPANPKIPYIIDSLEMKNESYLGRGIYTTRDLKPGDIIAIEDIRFNHIMDATYERCCMCLKPNNLDLLPVDKASLMVCSVECRDKKDTLRCFSSSKPGTSLDKVRSDFDLPWEAHTKAIKMNNRKLKTIFDFDWSKLSGEACNEALLICFYGLMYCATNQCEKPQTILEYFGKIMRTNQIKLNAYDIRNDGKMSKEQAECYLLFGSLINHACDPNIMRFEIDRSLVFYVAKPIVKGQQLFVSYITDPEFFSLCCCNCRRIKLDKEYFFYCKCEVCSINWPLSPETEYLSPKNYKNMTVEEAIAEFKQNNEKLKSEFDYDKAQYLIHRNIRLINLAASYHALPFNV